MSRSIAGLKQILLCDSGTLLTVPTNPHVAGLRNAATMARTPFKDVKTYLNQSLRNMINFKIDFESLQPSLGKLKSMIGWANLNCDAQIVTSPQSIGGSSDVYQFIGVNKLGLDFEYLITADKRSMKTTLEAAMEYNRAQAMVDSADTTAAIAVAGITGAGNDYTKYRAPFFLAFEAPQATALFAAQDLTERSFSIKTKNKKDLYNTSMVDYLTFNFTIAARDASVAKQVVMMSKDMSPNILVKEQNNSPFYDAFDFNAGVLSLVDEYNDADEARAIKLIFSADVPIGDITFSFGATFGGDAADTTGIKGGTMKIGY